MNDKDVMILKNFVKCIRKMYTENYSSVINQLISKKIPCAYFSSTPVDTALKVVMDFKKNFNIGHLVTIIPPPTHTYVC